MLVLTRKRAESIKIGNDIIIKVIQTNRGIVKLGIEAPAHVRILRAELTEFPSAPVTSGTGAEVTAETSSDDHPEAAHADECVMEFHLDHDVEVSDLMMCVGAH